MYQWPDATFLTLKAVYAIVATAAIWLLLRLPPRRKGSEEESYICLLERLEDLPF